MTSLLIIIICSNNPQWPYVLPTINYYLDLISNPIRFSTFILRMVHPSDWKQFNQFSHFVQYLQFNFNLLIIRNFGFPKPKVAAYW